MESVEKIKQQIKTIDKMYNETIMIWNALGKPEHMHDTIKELNSAYTDALINLRFQEEQNLMDF